MSTNSPGSLDFLLCISHRRVQQAPLRSIEVERSAQGGCCGASGDGISSGSRSTESKSYICPNGGAQLAFGNGRDRIGTYRSRDHERLSVMDNKWGETVFRTFDINAGPLDEIQHMDSPRGVVLDPLSEPMPSGLDELRCMKTGSFFPPSVFFLEHHDLIHKLLCNPLRVSVPLDIPDAVIYVNGPRPTIQA